MGLIDDVGSGPVAVDSAVIIYFIEADPRYLPIIEPLFRETSEGKRALVTSGLTLLEVLVVPYRDGNRVLAERYEAVLTRSRGFRLVDLSRDQLRAAAQLRAVTGVKIPDGLQMAAALASGCTRLVTNDRRLPAVPGLRVIQLSSYAQGSHASA